MTIAQVGSIAKAASASGTSHVVTLPQAATAGNLLVVAIGGSAGAVRAPGTTPTGWTSVIADRQLNTPSAGMEWIYAKVAAGGETSVTFTWTGNMVPGSRAIEYSGVDVSGGVAGALAFVSASIFFSNNATETTATFLNTAHAAATAGEYSVCFIAGRGTNPLGAHAFGTGWTEADTAASGGVGVIQSAHHVHSTVGDSVTPAASYTNSQGQPVMGILMLSLKPATAADTVTVTNPGAQVGTVGTAITPVAVAASDTLGHTLTYSATGLPPGLSINSSTGSITGTPTTAGTYSSCNVVATCTGSQSDNKTLTWTIAAAGSVRKARVAGAMSAGTRKARVAGAMSAGTRKSRAAGAVV